MRKKSPCYNNGQGCPKRKSSCHSTCQDFKDWSKEHDEEAKIIRESRTHEIVMRDQAIRRAERLKKRR